MMDYIFVEVRFTEKFCYKIHFVRIMKVSTIPSEISEVCCATMDWQQHH